MTEGPRTWTPEAYIGTGLVIAIVGAVALLLGPLAWIVVAIGATCLAVGVIGKGVQVGNDWSLPTSGAHHPR